MKESVDMKKKSLIAILIVFLIISGCTNKQEVYYTVAEPFSDEQREALGMTEITNDYYFFPSLVPSYKGDDALRAIVTDYPGKALPGKVHLKEGRVFSIE